MRPWCSHGAQVVVHDLVTPPVQLVRRSRAGPPRSVKKLAVDRMTSPAASPWRLLHRRSIFISCSKLRAYKPLTSWLQSSENSSPPCSTKRRSRSRSSAAEPHKLVSGHEQEGKRQQIVRRGGDDDLLREDRDRRCIRRWNSGRWRRLWGCSPSLRSRTATGQRRIPRPAGGPGARNTGFDRHTGLTFELRPSDSLASLAGPRGSARRAPAARPYNARYELRRTD